MQIGSAIGRYNSNMQGANVGSARVSAPASNVQAQRGSELAGLQKGNVFEGTVGTMKGGQVQLQLSDGTSISARLGGDVQLSEGQSVFFEVKSNEGGTIEIRPFQTEGGLGNPTIFSALDAAGLPKTADNMRMVDTMMQEGMSIDKQSLGAMSRLIAGNSGINQTTLIEMSKLGLPISNEMAAQFENYKTDSYQILNKMTEILSSVSETLGSEAVDGEEALALNDKLVNILTGDGSEAVSAEAQEAEAAGQEPSDVAKAGENAAEVKATNPNVPNLAENEQGVENQKGVVPQEPEVIEQAKTGAGGAVGATDGSAQAQAEKAIADAKSLTQAADTVESLKTAEGAEAAQRSRMSEDGSGAQARIFSPNNGEPYAAGTLGDILSKEETAELEKNLRALDKDGSLTKSNFSLDMSAEDFAKALNDALKNLDHPDSKALKDLLSGKSYLSVLKEVTREQWTVKPEQLSGDRIKDLYENLDRQMKQTETMLKEMGMKDSELAKSVSDLKNNLEFMDQVNQNYTYLQIPIQFQNQTAHSDLYVYTNKKNLQDPDAELTAFLHLDMEHLGSTDVSVKMQHRAVTTKFYLEDDAAFDLIMAHADELAERLEKKGYNCKVEAVNDKKEVDLVEDFMKNGNSAGHMIHRYSFDIKA